MMMTVAVLAGSSAVMAEDIAVASAVRLGGDAAHTRLVVDLDRAVTPHVFVLANPNRLVVDLPNVLFRAGMPPEKARGLVSAFRFGLISAGRSRIVADLRRPVAVEKSFVVEAKDGEPARLVVELAPVSRDQFQRLLAAQNPKLSEPPSRETPKVPNASGADRRPVIVLDPGHGGVDAGAHGAAGEQEKDIVLVFAAGLRDQLERSGRYRVVMTREDDSFVSLPDRVRVARENGAKLFMSIHADSLSDPFGVRGATIYTLSDKASDAEAAHLAEKENRADLIAGVDLSDEPDDVAGILIDLTRRETKSFSAFLAKKLVGSMRDTVRLNKNPLRSAGFRVLKSSDVPSVLLEIGYMSNPQDLKLLSSESWRDKATGAIVAAVDGFFGTRVAAGTDGSVDAR